MNVVVIPCYNVERQIESVIFQIPDSVDKIYLVNDRSTDNTLEKIAQCKEVNNKIILINNKKNLGVGGAVKEGIKHAINDGAKLIVKIDGDGQMNPKYIPNFFDKLKESSSSFVKANRFYDFTALKKMPLIRRIGNIGLTFFIRLASGYWNVSDPTNGYIGFHSKYFKKIDFDRLHNRYFFESSLIIELHYHKVNIVELPLSAVYNDEESNLSILHTLVTFPFKIVKSFFRRIVIDYFLYDYNVGSVYLTFGLPTFLYGIINGYYSWSYFHSLGEFTPYGTGLLSSLSLIVGLIFLVNFLNYDVGINNRR